MYFSLSETGGQSADNNLVCTSPSLKLGVKVLIITVLVRSHKLALLPDFHHCSYHKPSSWWGKQESRHEAEVIEELEVCERSL